MNHFTTPDFWLLYNALPREVRALADKNYDLLKADSSHPSLRFKNIEGLWSVRVGSHYRALGRMRADGLYWFWIGPHGNYDKFMPQTVSHLRLRVDSARPNKVLWFKALHRRRPPQSSGRG